MGVRGMSEVVQILNTGERDDEGSRLFISHVLKPRQSSSAALPKCLTVRHVPGKMPEPRMWSSPPINNLLISHRP